MNAVAEDSMKRKRLYLHKLLATTHMLQAKEAMLAAYDCTSTLQLNEEALDDMIERVRCIGQKKTDTEEPRHDKADANTRYWRHKVLRMVAACGVNTQDWNAVNAFLLDPRIAGRHLYELSAGELNNLHRKLQNVKANIEKKNDTLNNLTQHN